MENGTANNHVYPQMSELNRNNFNVQKIKVSHNTKRKPKKNINKTAITRKIIEMMTMDLMKISYSLSSVIKKK